MASALQIVQRFYPKVTEVKDALRGVTLTVTSKDAHAKGVKKHAECALAVACRRALKADGAIICVKSSYVIKGSKAMRFLNPASISREVVSFDRKAGFEPGEYTLSAVPPTGRLGTWRKYGKKTNKGKKPSYHRTENVRVISA